MAKKNINLEKSLSRCSGLLDLFLEYPDWKLKSDVGCKKTVEKLIKDGWIEEESSRTHIGRKQKFIRFKKIK